VTHQASWDDWNKWCDARIAAALAEHDRVTMEATGQALGMVRKQLRDEFAERLGQLRAEISIAKAHEDGQVVDLPSPLVRKRRDAA
jgi:hypothetical protein